MWLVGALFLTSVIFVNPPFLCSRWLVARIILSKIYSVHQRLKAFFIKWLQYLKSSEIQYFHNDRMFAIFLLFLRFIIFSCISSLSASDGVESENLLSGFQEVVVFRKDSQLRDYLKYLSRYLPICLLLKISLPRRFLKLMLEEKNMDVSSWNLNRNLWCCSSLLVFPSL